MAVESCGCYNTESTTGRRVAEKCTILYTPGPVGLVGVLEIAVIAGSDLSVE